MASSPAETRAERAAFAADRGEHVAAAGPVAFALRELTACWSQALAALAAGDLDAVAALLDVAQQHVGAAGTGEHDGTDEARLRTEAAAAFARLEEGMRAGIHGLDEELARCRAGARALRGYGRASLRVDGTILRDA